MIDQKYRVLLKRIPIGDLTPGDKFYTFATHAVGVVAEERAYHMVADFDYLSRGVMRRAVHKNCIVGVPWG